MSGYTGNPDAESEHALVLTENAIFASQQMLVGTIEVNCRDCGVTIPKARVEYARKSKMKCEYCVSCQESHDAHPRIKMLDRIL